MLTCFFPHNSVGGYNPEGIRQGLPQIQGPYELWKQPKVSDRIIEKNPGNGQKLLIKTSFLVVNTCGENSIIEKTETAGAAVLFILYFFYNSVGDVGDHIYILFIFIYIYIHM